MVPTDKQTDNEIYRSVFGQLEIHYLWSTALDKVTLVKASRTVKQIVFMHRQLTMNRKEKSPIVNEDWINVPISNATAEKAFKCNQYVWCLTALSDKDRNAMMSYGPDVNRGEHNWEGLVQKDKATKTYGHVISTFVDRFLIFSCPSSSIPTLPTDRFMVSDTEPSRLTVFDWDEAWIGSARCDEEEEEKVEEEEIYKLRNLWPLDTENVSPPVTMTMMMIVWSVSLIRWNGYNEWKGE